MSRMLQPGRVAPRCCHRAATAMAPFRPRPPHDSYTSCGLLALQRALSAASVTIDGPGTIERPGTIGGPGDCGAIQQPPAGG
jgi:hypothetical protein